MDVMELRLEAGRLRLKEMMDNGGRTVRKAKRRAKKTTQQNKIEIKGTIQKYMSKVVTKEEMMTTEGRKRKCDGLVVQERTLKKSRSSEDSEPDDRGTKSFTKIEPRLLNANKSSTRNDEIPREFKEKFTSQKTS